MARIKGVYRKPNLEPYAGLILRFALVETTLSSFHDLVVTVEVDKSGQYEVELSNGRYHVTAYYTAQSSAYLGDILVTSSSPEADLNEYLLVFSGAPYTALVDFVNDALKKLDDFRGEVVESVPSFASLPADAEGFWLVRADETKGDAPTLYLCSGGLRYWVAMVRDDS